MSMIAMNAELALSKSAAHKTSLTLLVHWLRLRDHLGDDPRLMAAWQDEWPAHWREAGIVVDLPVVEATARASESAAGYEFVVLVGKNGIQLRDIEGINRAGNTVSMNAGDEMVMAQLADRFVACKPTAPVMSRERYLIITTAGARYLAPAKEVKLCRQRHT